MKVYKKIKKGGAFALSEYLRAETLCYIRTIYFDSARHRSNFIKSQSLILI